MSAAVWRLFIPSFVTVTIILIHVIDVKERFVIGILVFQTFARIRNGTLMGERHFFEKQQCDVYLGIPFARPPTYSLRLKLPVPPSSWNGIARASSFGPACMQPTGANHLFPAGTVVSEDCLFLNIFAPVSVGFKPQLHPVLVWIHGGGFFYGAGSALRPEDVCSSMVSKKIVVVTINYRLGVFGFGFKSSENMTANLGLYDQVQAVRWIKENIASFGGDPNRVTLAGQGSGAVCVSLLSISPMHGIADLFQQTIMMSGSALSSWAVTNHAVHSTRTLMRSMDCSHSSTLIECLEKKPADEIIRLAPNLWSPMLDEPSGIIPKLPRNSLLDKTSNSVTPAIMGFTKDEAALLLYKKLIAQNVSLSLDAFEHKLLPDFVKTFLDSMNPLEEAIKFQYFSIVPTDNVLVFLQSVIDLYSDYLFKAPILYEAMLRTEKPNSAVYLYTYENAMSLDNLLPGWHAAAHGSDLPSLWGWKSALNLTKEMTLMKPPGRSSTSSSIVADLWSDFVKYGYIPPVAHHKTNWLPYQARNKAILKIGKVAKIANLQEDSRLRFWTSFVPQLLKSQEAKADRPLQTQLNASSVADEQLLNMHSSNRTSLVSAKPVTSIFWPLKPMVPPSSEVLNSAHDNAGKPGSGNIGAQLPAGSSHLISKTHKPKTQTIIAALPAVTANYPLMSSVSTGTTSTIQSDSGHIAAVTTSAGASNESSTPSNKESQMDENTMIMWIMVALALTFFLLFLFTAGTCAVWNKQTYYTRSPKRSNRQIEQIKISGGGLPMPNAASPPTCSSSSKPRPNHNGRHKSPSANMGSQSTRPPNLPPRPSVNSTLQHNNNNLPGRRR